MSKIIYRGQEYISGSQYQELTQTEYNALSEAEKKNGTLYFVTDGVPGGGQDYVVEQGTNGIWTYRKWASGIAECWGAQTWTITSWSTWGSWYFSTRSPATTYPSGLFTAIPCITALMYTSNGDVAVGPCSTGHTKDKPPQFVGYRPAAGTNNVTGYLHMHAIGKWS